MIRFFDKEICSVSYETLNRRELRSFFLQGNRKEIVCVFDHDGAYRGQITYPSLLASGDIYSALCKEYVVLDEQVWKNGREFFKKNRSSFGGEVLLPVLNKTQQLICFAYQDKEANRELRMLGELEKNHELIDFSDLYPSYDLVTISGFNELAYFFARYLCNRGIAVNVEGELWDQIGDWSFHEGLDYRNFVVHAEGIVQKEQDVEWQILHSVSAEFECIDHIYETNYKAGRIKDAGGDLTYLLTMLRKHANIIIMGTGVEALSAYDFLIGQGIDICCFVGDGKGPKGQLLKPI